MANRNGSVTPRWLRRAWYWSLDYAWVAWRQLLAAFDRGVPERFAHGDKSPVLLLPGVYEPWTLLRPVAERLGELGHPVHVLARLGYNRIPIPDAAAIAHRYLEHHDLRAVLLIAHSKGGLIGKHLMAVDDAAGRVDRLIAISTPFGGSRYADFMLSSTLREFRPRGETISALSAQGAVNSRITSVFGEFDPHIPAGSALDGAVNVELPVMGHFRVLSDPRLIDAVVDAAEALSP
jgi:hypothetical protein